MAQTRKNNGINGVTYTARVRIKDKEVTKTFRLKKEADDWAKEKEIEIKYGRSPTAESRKRTVSDLIVESLKITKREHPHRHKKKKERLSWWQAKLGSIKLFEIQAIDICQAREDFLEETCCRNKKRETSTANRYMTDLRQAFQHGVERLGWLQFNVVKQIKQLAEPDPPERFLDKDTELDKLAQQCLNSRNKRLYPLFMLAINIGLRKGSLVGLQEEDVNLRDKTIRIPKTRMKRSNMITLEVAVDLMPILKSAYDNRHPETGLLFPGQKDPTKPMDFRGAWEGALKRAGVKDFRWHDLRHTAGTYFTDEGLPLHEVAALLGQKTLEMAKRYAHVTKARKAKAAPAIAKGIHAKTSKTTETYLSQTTTKDQS